MVSSGDKILRKASLAQEKNFFQATAKQKGGGLVQICWHFCPQTIAAQIIESVESKFIPLTDILAILATSNEYIFQHWYI